jgi:hypothetical protein
MNHPHNHPDSAVRHSATIKYPDALALSHEWRAFCGEFSSTIEYKQANDTLTSPFSLPMDARSLLHKEGKCADPRICMQSRESDWSMGKEWWFVTRFSLPALKSTQRAYLRVRGVDYIAEYFIDRTHAGSTESFNQECFFDITAALAAGAQEHELAVRLWGCRPHEIMTDAATGRLSVRRDPESLKANMLYGGDHNACVLTCGIAVAPRIIIADNALVQSIMPDYAFDADYAQASGRIVVKGECWGDTDFSATIAPRNFEGRTHAFRGRWSPSREMAIEFDALPVKPWQPLAHGFPHCYLLTIKAGGREIQFSLGFRKFERRKNAAFVNSPLPSIMDWHPYENNRRYGSDIYKGFDAVRELDDHWPAVPREGDYNHDHVVNGARIFIHGGSVVPTHLFWSDFGDDYLRRLIREAREANNNLLRVWGGGYLNGDAFFDEADLQGVMITHDFLNFGRYADMGFDALQKREKDFRSVVRQTNHHPSVVVYTGGNEMFQGDNHPNDPIFKSMARIVAQESRCQYFSLSSPVNPEVHGPWHWDYEHPARYNSSHAIFNSECGIVAPPAYKSVRAVLSHEETEELCGQAWRHRGGSVGQGMIDHRERQSAFGVCATALDYINHAQYLQAIGYQYLAEEYRRQSPAMSGFTTWEYNEPWIDTAWGLLDNRLVRKQSFWAFRRACAPKLISARFPGYLYLPGETFNADLYFCADSDESCAIAVTAAIYDEAGATLGAVSRDISVSGSSTPVGAIECTAPARGAFFLRLSALVNATERIENEYSFCVLTTRAGEPIPMLYISGGNYEDELTMRMLTAAGFRITRIIAGPRQRLDVRSLRPDDFRIVALGAVFNPITSLTPAFYAKIKQAIADHGLGFVYFGYNSSACVSGRYDVDDIRGSALEELLPVRFAKDCYQNSHNSKSTETELRRLGDHPVWSGIPVDRVHMGCMLLGVEAKDGVDAAAKVNEQPALVFGKFGAGTTGYLGLPFAGHSMHELGFRMWKYAHRLYANMCEFAATGAVTERELQIHPFAPLIALPRTEPEVRVSKLVDSADEMTWSVEVSNAGPVPVLGFEIGNPSDLEGDDFDFHASENFFTIFAHEKKRIDVRAIARPGHRIPEDLSPCWYAWNSQARNAFDPALR